MSPVVFLLIAAVVAIVGTVIVTIASRKPSRPDSAMADFEREMEALAPRSDLVNKGRRDEAGSDDAADEAAPGPDEAAPGPDEAAPGPDED